MSITEAARLAMVLAGDSTSHTFAALNDWRFPAGPEFFVLADLFDAYATVNFKKPQPYPRPQPEAEASTERFGEVIRPESIADVLRAFGREVPAG